MEAPGSNEGAAVVTPPDPTAAAPRPTLPRSAIAAIAAAGVALVLTIATTIVVLGRSSPAPAAATPESGRTLIETTATAEAVLALLDDGALIRGDQTPFLVPFAPAALGLLPGDELISFNGRPLRTALDVRSALRPLLRTPVEALLLEIRRGGGPAVVRIAIGGDLTAAYNAWLAARRPSRPSSSPSDPDVAAIVAGITKIDDDHVEISRAAADLLRADPARLLGGARVVPSFKNGVANGFKLYAIRPASIIAALGLSNGDTVGSINDHELTSMDQALEAYRVLRDDTSYQLDLTRRGQDVTLTITVR